MHGKSPCDVAINIVRLSFLYVTYKYQTVSGYMGYLEKGYKVTIIVKSDGKAINGSFTFDSNYDNLK